MVPVCHLEFLQFPDFSLRCRNWLLAERPPKSPTKVPALGALRRPMCIFSVTLIQRRRCCTVRIFRLDSETPGDGHIARQSLLDPHSCRLVQHVPWTGWGRHVQRACGPAAWWRWSRSGSGWMLLDTPEVPPRTPNENRQSMYSGTVRKIYRPRCPFRGAATDYL